MRIQPDDPAARQWAGGVIDRQTAQLSRMVDDLLDVERINRGRIDLRLEPLALDEVLGRAVEAVRTIMEQKGHTFTAEIASGKLRVQGDAARLEQIFVNLLGNAVKYTPEKGQIRLHRARDQSGGSRFRGGQWRGHTCRSAAACVRSLHPGPDLARPRPGRPRHRPHRRPLPHRDAWRPRGCQGRERRAAMQGSIFTVQACRSLTGGHLKHTRPPPSRNPCQRQLPSSRIAGVLIVDDHVDTAQALFRASLTRRNCEVRASRTMGPRRNHRRGREFQSRMCSCSISASRDLMATKSRVTALRGRAARFKERTLRRDLRLCAGEPITRARSQPASIITARSSVDLNSLLTVIQAKFSPLPT